MGNSSVTRCHLALFQITIEGVVHDKLFEADPNIQYTYAWDRLNEYRQVSTASTGVGGLSPSCMWCWVFP